MSVSQNPVIGPACNYNNQICVGGFKPAIRDLYRTNSPHGLSLTTAYVYGGFFDEDGGVYNYMRNIGTEGLPVVYLYYKAPGGKCVIHPEIGKFFTGMGVNRRKGDEVRIHSWRGSGIPGPGFSARLHPENMNLVEEGLADISGKRVGLAMNVYFPQGGQDVYYSSMFFEVEGTLFGKNIRGALGYDQVYGPPGEIWQTMRFFNGVQRLWCSGINVYGNGEKEMYHVVCGKGDWGFFFASSGEKVTAISRTVKANIELDKDDYPASALIQTDCGDWQWKGLPDCHLNPESQNLPLRWVEGPVTRVNEQRSLVFGSGWMEVYPGHL